MWRQWRLQKFFIGVARWEPLKSCHHGPLIHFADITLYGENQDLHFSKVPDIMKCERLATQVDYSCQIHCNALGDS